MTGPHVDQLGRDHLDDFGLLDDDATEDLRPKQNGLRESGVDAPAEAAHTHKPF